MLRALSFTFYDWGLRAPGIYTYLTKEGEDGFTFLLDDIWEGPTWGNE